MTTDVTLNAVALSTAVPDAAVLSVGRPLAAGRRHQRVEVPGRAGGWTFDEQPGDRLVTIIVSIESDSITARRSACRDLADWADVGTTAHLIVDDEPDRYHEAILNNAPNLAEWLRHSGDLPLEFLVGPYALAVSTSSEAATASGLSDTDTFAVPDDVPADPVITLTPTGGNMTGFALTVNGDGISWGDDTEPVLAGDSIVISTISETVTRGANDDVNLTGAFDPDDVSMADVSGGPFPQLVNGTNTWALVTTGTHTAVQISIEWRRRYR